MSVIALQRQRFAVRDLPVLSNGVDQLGQSQLAVPVRFVHNVFDDPAFQINRSIVFLAGGGRSIPHESFKTQRISARFSQALFREVREVSSSSSSS
jgi:hypothetical protein